MIKRHKKDYKSVFIGAGGLASSLAPSLNNSGCMVQQVYSRTLESAARLGSSLGCEYTNQISGVIKDADIYFFCVTDDSLISVMSSLPDCKGLFVHTSGSQPLKLLSNYSDDYGVFYPLQTFTRNSLVNFDDIPVCIEANSKGNEKILFSIATAISDTVHYINSHERKLLHLAAVFSCNFVNYLNTVAQKIVEENELEFGLLKPLIKETVQKVLENKPSESQTGPAVRGDKRILNEHIKLLENSPDAMRVYQLLSDNIYKLYRNNK